MGLTEEAAAALGEGYVVGRGRFLANSRANISGATEGMVKLVIDRATGRILGVHILGEQATEAIQVGQAVVKHGETVDYFITTTLNVPTLCEAYKYAAYDAVQRLNEPVLA